MQTYSIFKAGNSHVVAIPKHLSDELNFKPGQKVTIDKTPEGNGIVIKKAVQTTVKSKQSPIGREFNKWLENVLIEDSEVLDGLA